MLYTSSFIFSCFLTAKNEKSQVVLLLSGLPFQPFLSAADIFLALAANSRYSFSWVDLHSYSHAQTAAAKHPIFLNRPGVGRLFLLYTSSFIYSCFLTAKNEKSQVALLLSGLPFQPFLSAADIFLALAANSRYSFSWVDLHTKCARLQIQKHPSSDGCLSLSCLFLHDHFESPCRGGIRALRLCPPDLEHFR